MRLEIYQCDKCGAECNEYHERVAVNFPYGKTYDLCIKCAMQLFPKKEDDTIEDWLQEKGVIKQ